MDSEESNFENLNQALFLFIMKLCQKQLTKISKKKSEKVQFNSNKYIMESKQALDNLFE